MNFRLIPILATLALLGPQLAGAAVDGDPLRVSPNRRYLCHADGSPFFYLGDTAWELFHRLNREEATRYLEDRARKGFTVIQAVALAEIDRLTVPNAYGELPLSGQEGVGIVRFLMVIEKPTPAIVSAIEGAVAWFRAVAICGERIDRIKRADGRTERVMVSDPHAPLIWARFYELGTNRPLYTDRRSQPFYSFAQMDYERRSGYNYHTDAPAQLLQRDYPAWRARLAQSN